MDIPSICRGIGLALVLAASASARPVVLDNGLIRVAVVPEKGGAVGGLTLEKAVSFPLIADKGAGVAGSGSLFAPIVECDGKIAHGFALEQVDGTAESLTMTAKLDNVAPGLAWRRRVALAVAQTSLTIEDTLTNASDRELHLQVGSDSVQQAEKWRLTDRSWIGSEASTAEFESSTREEAPARARVTGRRLFWRQIEQYGTGFLYRTESPRGGEIRLRSLSDPGRSLEAVCQLGGVTVPAGGRIVLKAEVTVDEGGGAPDQNNVFYPVLARADFAHAGRSGEMLLGCATLVSPRSSRVLVTVRSGRLLAQREMELEAGKAVRLPVPFLPGKTGEIPIEVTVTAGSRKIGFASTRALIDGDDRSPVWRRFTHRMPESVYRGSWQEIGGQLVRGGQPIGYPTAMPLTVAKDGNGENGVDFYAIHHPYYADLLRGAAKAAGVSAHCVFLRSEPEDPRGACMDSVYYGPDGPINAFSKERYEGDFHGEGYVKVLPAQGYPFHYFESYGVNSEGLSISGAAGCSDRHTYEAEKQRLTDWEHAGRHTMPAKAAIWTMFATCRTVDEALEVISDPLAPMLFDGNMFLVDRAGNAARVESVGMEHQIYRHRPQDGGLFTAGNYQHERKDGLFRIGDQWGWSANTMVREVFLGQWVGSRQGHVGLSEVMALMQAHEAGGMCQHHYDNPGQLYTCCSYIAVPKTSELWLAQGPTCEVGYVRYTLAP